MKLTIYLSLAIAIALSYGCDQMGFGSRENIDDHSHSDDPHLHDEEEMPEDEVHLMQEQMDVMNITLSTFQYLNLSTTVRSNGRLELPPQKKANMSSVVEGRVKSIEIVQGDFVHQGQIIAYLEHPEFVEVQEEYMKASQLQSYHQTQLDRDKQLFESGTISEKELQQAEIEYIDITAEVRSLEAKLKMLELDPDKAKDGEFVFVIPVRAPIKGHVRQIEINIGMYVLPGQEMFEIADNDHIHIDLNVYEKDMGQIKEGQKVMFSLAHDPDSIYQASIFAIGKAFDREPKTMTVHAEIENELGNLLPGMYVDARIITNEEVVRSLPSDAIVTEGGLQYIFALKPNSGSTHNHDDGSEHAADHSTEYEFKMIEVNTGARDIGFTEVVPTYDLPDHVEIVTHGSFYLLAEMNKGSGEHGHSH